MMKREILTLPLMAAMCIEEEKIAEAPVAPPQDTVVLRREAAQNFSDAERARRPVGGGSYSRRVAADWKWK